MGLYTRFCLPYLLDWMMSGPEFVAYRRALLAAVRGNVLEIGFGTGLNLPYYSDRVTQLTTIDINPGLDAIAQKRILQSAIAITHQQINRETLPMQDNTFDGVVSTWTLCSIVQVEQALREIHRVLKPGGQFFCIEHGLSPDPSLQVWQNRLTPLQKVIAGGCHLNRPIQTLVAEVFPDVLLEAFYAPEFPRLAGYFYRGVATKASVEACPDPES
jgi:ubiquinone/menaquinone biosynthesis C-methylase UbiE